MIVGAITSKSIGMGPGRAYVVFGGPGPYPDSVMGSDADIILVGQLEDDQFGLVSGGGDVNNDGFDDLLIGAKGWFSGSEFGRAYAYLGGVGPFSDTLLPTDADYVFTGATFDDQLGAVSIGGDFNNDGFDDMIVGASNYDSGGSVTGRVYVFYGLNSDTLWVINGEEVDSWFGESVSFIQDLNQDGRDEVIIAASIFGDSAQPRRGRVWVYSLSEGGDGDGDGLSANCDNCPEISNPGQEDTDGNGTGAACQPCAIAMTGDVDLSNAITSGGIIYMVNFVFKGGTTPQPCQAAGDVNCDGSDTSSDIIFLVNHVFKSGPDPCF